MAGYDAISPPGALGSAGGTSRPRRYVLRAAAVLSSVAVVVASARAAGAHLRHASSWRASLATRLYGAPARRDPLAVRISNEYERGAGRQIGDGMYPYDHLAEVHQETKFEILGDLSSDMDGDACQWILLPPDDSQATRLQGVEARHTLEKVGPHTLTLLVNDGGTAEPRTLTVTVWAKHVRREIRELSAQDRARYFAALHTMYVVDMDTGGRRYGPHYRSAAWLVREHLYGAAQQDCDHWHDDAGFVNHHVGVTWQFEQSLQAIDPRVSAHYWDYTIDAASNSSYAQSLIFSEDWFGPASPQQEDHVVNIGRWAFTPVLQDARKFSAITNPYGLLRSPWNTNPVPYLTRYSQVLGSQNDGYSLTTCDDFSAALSEYNWIGDFFAKLDGKLHGPVHIMIGGHWDVDTQTASWLGSGMGDRSQALLASKWLWRQGYVRCPGYCSTDAPKTECVCSCPASITGDVDSEEGAKMVMGHAGLLSFAHRWGYTDPSEYNSSYVDILKMLCHIGHPGEMFTSAAPQDPTFWPLHGNAERFMTLARLLAAQGRKTLDETWGYRHTQTLMSDTHMECDWSNATGLHMPQCTRGQSCSGHRADDLLPFMGLWPAQTRRVSNQEMYDFTSPQNTEMPYVYSRLLYWPACANQTIWSD